MGKQYLALWRDNYNTKRQAGELILGPDPATRARLLSLNRIQTRFVTGLLTGHNTFRRHLCIKGIGNDHRCRKYGTGEETSIHILCECETLASLRYTYLGYFYLDPDNIKKLGVGSSGILVTPQGSFNLVRMQGTKGLF